MRVLIVNRYMSIYGGAETVVKEIALGLKNLGIENLITSLNVSESLVSGDLNIKVPERFFPYKLRSISFLSCVGVINEIIHLRHLVKKHAKYFDLINVHNFPANWVIAGLKKPIVWMCNEPPDLWNNPAPSPLLKVLRYFGIKLDRFFVNRYIDKICVADILNAQRVYQRYRRQAEIVPYGIEYEFFSSEPSDLDRIYKKYDIDRGDFIITQVGDLSPQKNQLVTIKAIGTLKDKIPNIKLILVGKDTGVYRNLLQDYIEKKELKGFIIFTGQMSKADVRDIYYTSKIAVFPVREQGGWLSPFEALSCKIPIIVYPSMGAASVIEKHKLGIVNYDLEDMILEIHKNYSHYKEISQKAGEWIRENLSWKKFIDKMVDIFKEVLRCEY